LLNYSLTLHLVIGDRLSGSAGILEEFEMPENAAAEGGFGRDAPSRSDDNDRGGAREDREKAEKDFDRAMDNANRPDRAPASSPDTTAASDSDDDDNRPTDAGDSSTAASTNTPSAPDAPEPDEEEDDRGFFDRAGDFFGGLARGVQDFSRENPRVDSHGNPVGLVDADGIQRGEVASRVRSSGTSSEDLAEQLGFSSPQDMAAAQNTDFIEDKYQEELARRAIEEALDERYGQHPDVQAMLASGDFSIRQANFASSIPMMDAVKQAAEMMPEIPQEVWDETYEVMQEIGISALQGAAAGYAFGTATGAIPAGVVAMADSPLPGPADIAAGIGYGIYTGATTAAGALAGGGMKAAEIALEGLISYSEEAPPVEETGEVEADNKQPEIARQKQDGHIAGTPQHQNREKAGKPTSVFDDPKKADDLTQEAWEKGEQVDNKSHGVREYDFGTRIGTDPNGEAQTKVRVHQDSRGRIHGHPAGSGD
jgi:hypothetical protein